MIKKALAEALNPSASLHLSQHPLDAVKLPNHGFGILQKDIVSPCSCCFQCWESASGVTNIPVMGSGPSQPAAWVNVRKYVRLPHGRRHESRRSVLESKPKLSLLVLLAGPEAQSPAGLPVLKSPAGLPGRRVLLGSSLGAAWSPGSLVV